MPTSFNEPDESFCNESASNGTETLTIIEDLSFLQNVIPERSLCIELMLNQQCIMRSLAHLLGAQDRFAKEFRDGLSTGQTKQPPTKQVSHGECGHLLLTLKGRECFQWQRQGGVNTPGEIKCWRGRHTRGILEIIESTPIDWPVSRQRGKACHITANASESKKQ